MTTKSTTTTVQSQPKTSIRPKGFFRTVRELSAQVGALTSNGVTGLIYEQRLAQLRERTIGDAEFLDDLKKDAVRFGGLNECKKAHNELCALLEDLEL